MQKRKNNNNGRLLSLSLRHLYHCHIKENNQRTKTYNYSKDVAVKLLTQANNSYLERRQSRKGIQIVHNQQHTYVAKR
jgi:hypothetical protein